MINIKKHLIVLLIFFLIFAVVEDCYSCPKEDPVADITPYWLVLLYPGQNETFYSIYSYDPDNGEPFFGNRGITGWQWEWRKSDATSWEDGGSSASFTFTNSQPGKYFVKLTVVDDDTPPGNDTATTELWVVGIDGLVDSGNTTNYGPLFAPVGTAKQIKALPEPSDAPGFPYGQPVWSLGKPTGSGATLTGSGDSRTISTIDMPGPYIVTATYGPSSDSISVLGFSASISAEKDLIAYGSGMDFYLTVLPATGWLPYMTAFWIKNSSDEVVYQEDLGTFTGNATFEWDGCGDDDSYLDIGTYTAYLGVSPELTGTYDVASTSFTIEPYVNITSAPSQVLSYIVPYAGSQPPGTATAVGYPSGGEYSWSFTGEGGYMEFISGQNSSTTTFRGTWFGNITLHVSYTLGTNVAYDSFTVKVQKMNSTGSVRGNYIGTTGYKKVKYYHKVYDQDGIAINVTGIPCTETLTLLRGVRGAEGPGPTGNWPPDGLWTGGICVRDSLKYNSNDPVSDVGQLLRGGGWIMDPYYYIHFDINRTLILWKDTTPPSL